MKITICKDCSKCIPYIETISTNKKGEIKTEIKSLLPEEWMCKSPYAKSTFYVTGEVKNGICKNINLDGNCLYYKKNK